MKLTYPTKSFGAFVKQALTTLLILIFVLHTAPSTIVTGTTAEPKTTTVLPSVTQLTSKMREIAKSEKTGDVIIRGKIPNFNGYKNKTLQKNLNDKIDMIYKDFQTKFDESTLTITVSYEVKTYSKYVSLLLSCQVESSSRQSYMTTIAVDTSSEKIVTISDVLGANGIKIGNGVVTALIAENPQQYNASFKGIKESQDFFVENGNLILIFDKYEIAPGSEGIVRIPIIISDVTNFYVDSGDYYAKKDAYNLKMMQLKQLIDAFNYTTIWNPMEHRVDIYKNNIFSTYVKIGENSYFKSKMPKKTLEAAPEIKDGRTYVPITFFEEILGLYYSVDKNGTITFSSYE